MRPKNDCNVMLVKILLDDRNGFSSLHNMIKPQAGTSFILFNVVCFVAL